MRPGGLAAHADGPDDLPSLDLLANHHINVGQVTVFRLDSVTVVDQDLVAVSLVRPAVKNHAFRRGLDARAVRSRNVHPRMERSFAAERVHPLAKPGRDLPPDGPN